MRSENLHRNGAVEAGIAGAVNFSHTACAQLRLDFIRAEFRARGESHSGSRNYSLSARYGGLDSGMVRMQSVKAAERFRNLVR